MWLVSLSVFSPNDNGKIICDFLQLPFNLEDISNPVVNLTTFTNMKRFSEEKKWIKI